MNVATYMSRVPGYTAFPIVDALQAEPLIVLPFSPKRSSLPAPPA